MILLIDNYDSFSYNLYQLIGGVNPDIKVIRNDELSIPEIEELNPIAIILSPGPGRPVDAGVFIDVIKYFKDKTPILGVCLGHQAICEAFGATITYAKEIMHGKTSIVSLNNKSKLFKNMDNNIEVARYHSLAADINTMPNELIITAKTKDNEIMAVEHQNYNVFGVQFHPESVLTPKGIEIIRNFMKIVGDNND